MRLIDADLLIEHFNKSLMDLQVNGDDALLNYSGIFKVINAAPTVSDSPCITCVRSEESKVNCSGCPDWEDWHKRHEVKK